MATLSPQTVTRSGLAATYASAASGGDQFLNNGKMLLHVKNGATDCNVTVSTPNTVDGLAIADLTVTVSASTEEFIGPFPASIYNDSSGYVQLSYDDESNVTVAVLRYG